MQHQPELLSPREFYQNFLTLLENYEQSKLPSFLRSLPSHDNALIEEAPNVQVEWDERPPAAKSKQGSFGAAFFQSIKKAAAKATVYNTAVHSPLIKFVAEEMEDILRQDCDPIKKMTDMTILFHGLHCYVITATHSKELRDLLDTLNRLIWINTQHQDIQLRAYLERADVENPHEIEAFHEGVVAVVQPALPPIPYTGPKHLASEADRRSYMTPLANYTAQLRAPMGDVENQFTLPEQQEFIERYSVQIQRAYELMCHNTTEVSKADFRQHYKYDITAKYDPNRLAHLKDPTTCYTLITNYDLWHYRVRDSRDVRTSAEIENELMQRRAVDGNTDLQGNSLQRAWAYQQTAVELTKPAANMGRTYNPVLRSLDPDAFTLPPREINREQPAEGMNPDHAEHLGPEL